MELYEIMENYSEHLRQGRLLSPKCYTQLASGNNVPNRLIEDWGWVKLSRCNRAERRKDELGFRRVNERNHPGRKLSGFREQRREARPPG